MGRKIKTWRDPYGEGFSTCRKREIEIIPGLTVLVGCNGAGKTTLLKNISSELKKENIPVFFHSEDKDGGSKSIGANLFDGDMTTAAAALCSSEGENITINLGKIAGKLRQFILTGRVVDKQYNLMRALAGETEEKPITSNERWVLLDAMDSGYSIDNVIDMKNFFQVVMEDAEKSGIELYIVISSNEFELAYGENCFDVMCGKYIRFEKYEEYKKFILKTREKKEKRHK